MTHDKHPPGKAPDHATKGGESTRHHTGTKGKSNRPTGKSTARDSTGVDPQEPIDQDSPTPKRGGG